MPHYPTYPSVNPTMPSYLACVHVVEVCMFVVDHRTSPSTRLLWSVQLVQARSVRRRKQVQCMTCIIVREVLCASLRACVRVYGKDRCTDGEHFKNIK